ncbi:hypothetical protein MPRM_12030 [Mycobacterium parmense]|uniref:Uncharacterized protein n=2 Tax=Mycobacterium parmense TaxID=185642 RepID=A0A7I7YRW6_9MYCO|nr:hypothetical protein MPRM_12030 [Mycobacterium parmense]
MIAATIEERLVVQLADVIAVFRYREGGSAIWHVDISPSTPLTRLCGAWVTGDACTLRNVLAARLLLPFGGRLITDATELADRTVGIVDPNATLANTRDRISELDALHRDSKTAAGQPRAPIIWPALPQPLDWAALPPPPRGVNPDPFVAETIAVARWFAELAEVWSKVEVARTSRQHLACGDLTPQPLPVALTPTDDRSLA